ncbi:MAG: GntR family transcriptional regulator [Aquabacterium sp.]|nr:GntR family transcriptional regulator [Aquabacterium sp.]
MIKLLDPILRQSLSGALYVQLKGKIVSGELKPGDRLSSERVLSEESGVNRGAVREAIKRLEQAGLVAVHQGGKHEVLDYREEAGLELLPSLLIDRQGQLDGKVVRSIMAMRSALAPEIAAAAAQRGGEPLRQKLDAVLSVMQASRHDLAALQSGDMRFWQLLVKGSDNIAYQLAFNSMRRSYQKAWDKLTYVLAHEFQDTDSLQAIVLAVGACDPGAARVAALRHVEIGRMALDALFTSQA